MKEHCIQSLCIHPQGPRLSISLLFSGVRMNAKSMMVLSVLCFSAMQVCVKLLSNLPTVEVILARGVVSLLLTYYALRKLQIPMLGTKKFLLVVRGVVGTLALYLFFFSIKALPISVAVTIHYLTPIATIIIGGIAFREHATWRQWMAFIFCIAGVYLIEGSEGNISTTGVVAGIVSVVGAGVAYNIIRGLKEHEHPLVVMFYFPLIVVPLALPFTYQQWVQPSPVEWGLLLAVGVLTQFGQYYLTKAYQAAKASDVAHVNYLGAPLGIFYGITFFGEVITMKMWTGIGLIFLGLTLNHLTKLLRSLRR